MCHSLSVTRTKIWLAVLILAASCDSSQTAHETGRSSSTRNGSVTPSPRGAALSPDALEVPVTCREDQLLAAITWGEGSTGYSWKLVSIFNVGAASCSISTRPSLELQDERGAVVAVSQGRQPWYVIHATSDAEALDATLDDTTGSLRLSSPKTRYGVVSLAQGTCTPGAFPQNGRLYLRFGGTGLVRVSNFTGDLPQNYNCGEGSPTPFGPPELLVSELKVHNDAR